MSKPLSDQQIKDAQEKYLVGMDYIRKFTASYAMLHLFEMGIYEELEQRPSSVAELAEKFSLKPDLLHVFIEYCRIEGILSLEDEKYGLTPLAETLNIYRGRFFLFVGGYGETLQTLSSALKVGSELPERAMDYIGIGSCNIAVKTAVPIVKKLMEEVAGDHKLIVDIGCGQGAYLTTLCADNPSLHGIGVEPSEVSVATARAHFKDCGLADRLEMVQADAIAFCETYRGVEPDFIIFAYVLHEVLGQTSRGDVVKSLNALAQRFRGAHIIVMEADDIVEKDEIMSSPIGRGFYNPYFLVQPFTSQKLLSREAWRDVFGDAGLAIVAEEMKFKPLYDPAKTDVGYLLKPI